MRNDCSQYWEGLVALAEGQASEQASLHIRSCSECAERLRQLESVMRVGSLRYQDAPRELIERVKGMMAPKTVRARLLGSSLSASGARSVADSFQLLVGTEEKQARMMYSKGIGTWEVVGKAPADAVKIVTPSLEVELQVAGRFSFNASGLAETGFTILGEDYEIEVPSAEELIEGGTSGHH